MPKQGPCAGLFQYLALCFQQLYCDSIQRTWLSEPTYGVDALVFYMPSLGEGKPWVKASSSLPAFVGLAEEQSSFQEKQKALEHLDLAGHPAQLGRMGLSTDFGLLHPNLSKDLPIARLSTRICPLHTGVHITTHCLGNTVRIETSECLST